MGDQSLTIGRGIFFTFLAVICWIALFMWLGQHSEGHDIFFWAIMLIGSSVITFFAFLGLPGNVINGSFSESRIRLAITATLIITYLVYFGSVVYLGSDVPESGKRIASFAKDLLPTLTNLLMVTISFYFGSTAGIKIAEILKTKSGSQNTS